MNKKYGSDKDREKDQEKEKIKLARSFQLVFGEEGHRTEEQKFVMDTLKVWGFYDRPFNCNGPITAEALFGREGMREFFICIRTACEYKSKSTVEGPTVDTSSQVGK